MGGHRVRRWLRLLIVAPIAACAHRAAPLPPAITETAFVPGRSYFGASRYIEYIAGDAPVILTAPHGGALVPASIPDRTPARCGGFATTTTDLNTADLVRAMQRRYYARFGRYPHIVIARISRRKLDANRTDPEAACGNADADRALREWHDFIDIAKRAVLASAGKGWYMDIHGHGHPIQRLELGYLLSPAQTDLDDATLNRQRTFADLSSIRTIARSSNLTFTQLLRGPTSLGTLYANQGFPSLPSVQDPRPNGAPYFSGGDNTRRHACGADATPYGGVTGGMICGVQIESNFRGVRDTPANRDRFGDATAVVLEQYLATHWGLRLAPR